MDCLCILIQVNHKSWQNRSTNEEKYFRKEKQMLCGSEPY